MFEFSDRFFPGWFYVTAQQKGSNSTLALASAEAAAAAAAQQCDKMLSREALCEWERASEILEGDRENDSAALCCGKAVENSEQRAAQGGGNGWESIRHPTESGRPKAILLQLRQRRRKWKLGRDIYFHFQFWCNSSRRHTPEELLPYRTSQYATACMGRSAVSGVTFFACKSLNWHYSWRVESKWFNFLRVAPIWGCL